MIVRVLSLIAIVCFVASEAADVRVCRGDEVTIDLSDPTASKPLIYTLDTSKGNNELPPGLTLGSRSGVLNGVVRDSGFSNTYNINVVGTDPTARGGDQYRGSAVLRVDWCLGARVSRFFLVDAVSNKIVRVVNDGDTIKLGCEVGAFNMEVETFTEIAREAQSEGDLTAKVTFELDGKVVRTESAFPFTLGGDVGGNYRKFPIQSGKHRLTATPFNLSGLKGEPKTIIFTIV